MSYLLRFGLPLPSENVESLQIVAPWVAVTAGMVFGSLGLYAPPLFNSYHYARSVVVGVFISTLAVMAIAYWARGFAFPRTVFAISFPLHLAVMVCWRCFVNWWDTWAPTQRAATVITGRQPECPFDCWYDLDVRPYSITQVLCVNDVLTGSKHLSTDSDLVIVSGVSETEKRALVDRLLSLGRATLLFPEPEDVVLANARPVQIDDRPALLLSCLGLSAGQAFAKRLLDLSIALVAVVVTLPIMVIAAGSIALTSGFPIIYRQTRVGLDGRLFGVLKFRTMRKDAEAETGPILSVEGDTRITPVGRVLRAFRIDELPQLLNIIAGEMSIVGPRPERPEFVKDFAETIPAYRFRVAVKPGLTGLAQVKGRYSTRPEDKLLYDLSYITNYSLVLDLMIMLQTIVVLLTPSAAEGVRQSSSAR